MKTNFYILLVLLLSFSFANAQDSVEGQKTNSNVMVSENAEQVSTGTNVEGLSTETSIIEGDVARTNSDIRIYLNRLRNVENIDLLFPKINKALKA